MAVVYAIQWTIACIRNHGGETIHLGNASVGVTLKRLPGLLDFLNITIVHDVTLEALVSSANWRCRRLDAGQGTRDMDLLIAATALVHDLTLVTHNVQDFTDLPGSAIHHSGEAVEHNTRQGAADCDGPLPYVEVCLGRIRPDL